ncbi:MAG: hypothetical protein WA865_17925 [Spirulinaceae cyanobacterium]
MSETSSATNNKKISRVFIDILSFVVAIIASAILTGFLAFLIAQAFDWQFWAGLKSLLATVLPIVTIYYVTSFTEITNRENSIPLFNIYFIFTLWSIVLFVILQYFSSSFIPIPEVALSFTIACFFNFARKSSFQAFLSCAYGIVSGFLIYSLFFGIPVR